MKKYKLFLILLFGATLIPKPAKATPNKPNRPTQIVNVNVKIIDSLDLQQRPVLPLSQQSPYHQHGFGALQENQAIETSIKPTDSYKTG